MNRAVVLTLAMVHISSALFFPNGGFSGPGGFPSQFGGSGCTSLHTYCSPVLINNCQYGLAKDTHGCDLCQCAAAPYDPSATPVVHHHIQNPCIATQAHCTLDCQHYMQGPTGCQYCMCDNAHVVAQDTTTTPAATPTQSASTSVPVTSRGQTTQDPADCEIAKQICESKCNGEYLTDPHNCTFCVCKSDLSSLGK